MERVSITNEVSLSRLAYGFWRVSEDADTSPPYIHAKIEACLVQGITTMDIADIYGDYTAEGILGAALKQAPHLRDKIELVTKCGIIAPVGRYSDRRVKYYDASTAHINASVDTSLKEMATDRIDLLLLHRPDPLMDAEETGLALDRLVASGKVRSVGVSNFLPQQFGLLQGAMQSPIATNQIELSLTSIDAFANGEIAFLQAQKCSIMAWSPLGGGRLVTGSGHIQTALQLIADRFGTTRDAVAIAWLLAHPSRIIPVMGTNRLDRIARLHEALSLKMDRQTWYELYSAALGHPVS
jgi:predicted oxidoreductase